MTTINFLKGHPTLSLLPSEQIAKGYKKVLLEQDYSVYDTDPDNQHPLSYGTDPGNYDVRKSIASWNDHIFQNSAASDPNWINLTGGASYGFANILNTSTSASVTKRGFIVTPCYYLINGAFLDTGFQGKLTAIEETHNSQYDIDIEHLESQLIKYSEGLEEVNSETNVFDDKERGEYKLYRFVIYIVATFSNPGGLTYSVETRQKLIELARKYDMLIVSDDVYELLDYTESKLPTKRIVNLDRETSTSKYGNSVSNATFSKLIAPGVRFGWQETTTSHLALQFASSGANRSGGSPGQLSSLVVRELIESDEITNIIEKFKIIYKSRAIAIKDSIKKHLPSSTIVYGGDGGYFFWITLKLDETFNDHSKIVKILKENHNIVLAPGSAFEVSGDPKGWGKSSVRLSLSLLTESEIEAGIKKWGEVLRQEYPHIYE